MNEFLTVRDSAKTLILKKEKGKKDYHMWWEEFDDEYLNVIFTDNIQRDKNLSKWIMRPDAKSYIEELLNIGYKIV